MRIALTGNPNSGKTTMYNALTGRNEKVGNWAGVTVNTKEGTVKKTFCDEEIVVVDLPGAYSMSAFTSEENITSDYVKNEKPDVIINVHCCPPRYKRSKWIWKKTTFGTNEVVWFRTI